MEATIVFLGLWQYFVGQSVAGGSQGEQCSCKCCVQSGIHTMQVCTHESSAGEARRRFMQVD
jgi:hypothetical protein